MSRCGWTLCRLLLCGLIGCCLTASTGAFAAPPSTQKAKPEVKAGAPAMTQEQMMAEMVKLGTPGPNHEMLKKFEGTWKTVTKAWTGPGDPQTTEGTAQYAMVLGGRFLKQDFKGTFMGQPFEGTGLTGYDNKKGKFVMVWADVMTTGLLTADGTYDAAKKEMTFKGVMKMVGPPTPYRMVTKLVDDNIHVFSWYDSLEGKEVKTMEITYTRQ